MSNHQFPYNQQQYQHAPMYNYPMMMNVYNHQPPSTQFFSPHFYISNFSPIEESNPTKRKRNELQMYGNPLEEEDYSSIDSSDCEELIISDDLPGFKRVKKSALLQQLQQVHINSQSPETPPNNGQQVGNYQHSSSPPQLLSVQYGSSSSAAMNDDDYCCDEGEEPPPHFLPPPVDFNNPISVQTFEYKRRQEYNFQRLRFDQEKMPGEIIESMKRGENNFKLNPVLKDLYVQRSNRIRSDDD